MRRQTAGARARAQAALAVVVAGLESSARSTEGSSVLEGSSWVRAQVSLEKVEAVNLLLSVSEDQPTTRPKARTLRLRPKPVGVLTRLLTTDVIYGVKSENDPAPFLKDFRNGRFRP